MALALALAEAVVAQDQDEAGLPAELEALLDDLRPGVWQTVGSVSAAWGQRTNPGLSAIAPESAPFGQLGIEGFGRRETGRLEMLTMIDGRSRWYQGHPVVDDEMLWFGRGELQAGPWSWLELGVGGQGYWQDQVLDLTETIGARTVAAVEVSGGDLGAGARVKLPGGLAVEGKARWLRADYRGVPEDYLAEELRGEVTWTPWSWLEMGGATTSTERDYDFRGEATAGGRILEDTTLGFTQSGEEARARLRWKAAGAWTLEGRWSTLENRDGASGFYDYDRDRWSAELGWSQGVWTLRGRYERSDLAYRVQTVGAGLAPEHRTQEDRFWEVELRYELGDRWEVFGTYQRDESLSNDADASYTDSVAWAGVGHLF